MGASSGQFNIGMNAVSLGEYAIRIEGEQRTGAVLASAQKARQRAC